MCGCDYGGASWTTRGEAERIADIFEGIRIAAERATTLAGECWTLVADGAALPLKDAAFDAIGHSGLLCCLESKAEVLNECRRVVRRGGKMAFTVISVAPGLPADDYARAVRAGPLFKETAIPYRIMLEQTGWTITHHRNLTVEYAQAARRMLREEEARADALARVLGDAELSGVLDRRRRNIEALNRGLLQREMFVATPAVRSAEE